MNGRSKHREFIESVAPGSRPTPSAEGAGPRCRRPFSVLERSEDRVPKVGANG